MFQGLQESQLKGAIEALLFVTDEPVGTIALADMLEVEPAEAERALVELRAQLAEEGRGVQLREVAGGWRLYTHPAYHELVERYVLSWDTRKLSQAAMETLAIVAYLQPVTRGGVERPVCVLTADDGGRPILEYYSLPAYIRNPLADKKLYVKRVAIPRQGEAYGDMEIGGSPRLLVPVAMRCACYVSAALGNVPLSKYLEEETGKQMLRL